MQPSPGCPSGLRVRPDDFRAELNGLSLRPDSFVRPGSSISGTWRSADLVTRSLGRRTMVRTWYETVLSTLHPGHTSTTRVEVLQPGDLEKLGGVEDKPASSPHPDPSDCSSPQGEDQLKQIALHPGHKALNPGHKALNPGHKALKPGHKALNPGHKALNPGPIALNPSHKALNPGPNALNPSHKALNPGPNALKPGPNALNRMLSRQPVFESYYYRVKNAAREKENHLPWAGSCMGVCQGLQRGQFWELSEAGSVGQQH
ncbi:unnamed protein product [Arctogadus glacialis]